MAVAGAVDRRAPLVEIQAAGARGKADLRRAGVAMRANALIAREKRRGAGADDEKRRIDA